VTISTSQLSSVKETNKEFNLDICQLAFTIGEKTIRNGITTYIAYACTTAFSDEMSETVGRELDSDNAPTESTTRRSHSSKSSNCGVYKYAPRNGYTDSNDEVLIFLTNKLKPKRYGGKIIIFLFINLLFFNRFTSYI
jgi:hypothetical protein